MITFHGKSVYEAIAIGKLMFHHKESISVGKQIVKDCDGELHRFTEALKTAKDQLDELIRKASYEVGKDNADIFGIHKLMLEDADYLEYIQKIILHENTNAEYAVNTAGKFFSEQFYSMQDSYMRARASDVEDISRRIINILNGKENPQNEYSEPVILVAEDFTPSETVQLDKSKILAFVTSKGSLNSHTAILARTMGIPAIIGVDLISTPAFDGKIAVIDGFNGTVHLDPDEEFLLQSQNILKEESEKSCSLQNLIGKESITTNGKKINLYANIGNMTDLSGAKANDAEGIGLFRSEFIFLEKNTFPSEEEQFAIYKNVVETMEGKKVIIRTLDIGADKKADYFNLKHEENPALGLRAIRLCIKMPQIFKTQLKALLRAAVYGNLSVMYPMIISIDEIKQIKELVREVSSELESESIPYKIPEQGIMIETPASVMIAEDLAEEVSFFSIGTNDLTQYVLAIDRQNDELDDFYNPYHPAIIKMIELTIKSAHKKGIWVGICGELAGDAKITKELVSLGVDELSVSPSKILNIRKAIREI